MGERDDRAAAAAPEPVRRYRGPPAALLRHPGLRLGDVPALRDLDPAGQDHGRPVQRAARGARVRADRRVREPAAQGRGPAQVAVRQRCPRLRGRLMRDQADAAATGDWFATLDAILNPAAVAVVGASRDPDKTGGRILNSIKNGGYQGRVIAVNPRYESVGGWPCVQSVADIGDPVPPVAYIALPRETAIEQVADCGRAGIRGCIVVGTGFGEDSASGRKLEVRLAEAAAAAGVRLIGPNCLGFISSRVSLNLEAAITLQSPAQPGPAGIISQSGSLMLCIYHGIPDAGSGISFAVSVGNQVDLAVPELMRYGALDRSTSVLAIYAESLGDADEFLGAAALCQETGTRVLMLKTGASGVGA